MKRLVAGRHAVDQALRAKQPVDVVYVEQGAVPRELVQAAKARDVAVEERSRADLDRLAGGVRHQGVVAIGGPYPYVDLDHILQRAASPALLVALDQITDPRNFGAIVRSAVAFGADGIVTLKMRAAPVTPVVVRASAGGTEHARIARVTNLARTLGTLSERGLQIVGLAGEGAMPLAEMPEAENGRVLVVGSEGRGLRRLVRERCDVLARIDLADEMESLNAAVAAGIALYTCNQQRHQ